MSLRLVLLFFFFCVLGFAQNENSNYRTKRVAVSDSIAIDSVSINSSFFSLKTKAGVLLDSTFYSVDFERGVLYLKKAVLSDSLIIDYLRFPSFLTRTYKQLDTSIIVENTSNLDKLFKLSQSNRANTFTPFDGLTTSGSISRGLTIGNNQNSVLNSELDLQIVGKLSDKVSLRASIQDANIPLQENGYSQRLDEFDQIFIELESENWTIRAGDIDLENSNSYFAQFSKRVQGLGININLENAESKTNYFGAGALVRGQFASSRFIGQEGNQGPYKLQGQNGELYVLIVSGSEKVSVNGVTLERGENKDYIIDYNAGEIIFNPTFPITSEMRFVIDYQYSERNYSRFLAYGGASYENDKIQIKAAVYSENDLKNQPLQQNISSEQVDILSQAGDEKSLMTAPSASSETYNENRILYKKEIIGSMEVFVFSNNPDDELFSVVFSNVGQNQGNYIVSSLNAINTIYEYVPPVGGIPQGRFEPIVQLIAPVKLQMISIQGNYKPNENTSIDFDIAGSKKDLNLFSEINDDDNNGFAGRLNMSQNIIKSDSLWNLKVNVQGDIIDENFETIQRLYNTEFGRDWNLDQPFGNQYLYISGLDFYHVKKGSLKYNFQHLNFSDNYTGNRHTILADLRLNKFQIFSNSSFLKSNSVLSNSVFNRSFNRVVYNYNNGWTGSKISIENNELLDNTTNLLSPISQNFSSLEVFTGVGDSTKVFVEIGYKSRVNDSIRDNRLERVNRSNTYYINSKLVQNDNTNLLLYLNYRKLKYDGGQFEDEQSLNSRLLYNQKLFNQIITWNTLFETSSGTLPQQDFTYIAVEPGQGAYTWIDYNENGIQELEEFEIAQFQDQGTFIRVLLPNQIFIKTHRNRLSQTLTINPQQWATSENKNKEFWSHFYNQASYLIDRKIKREGDNFNLNPFDSEAENQLGLQLNFRNVLFFNRGKQHYTTSYTYLNNKSRNVLSFGFVENNLKSHQFNFLHKIKETWLISLQSNFDTNESVSENFASKNFNLDEVNFNPKLSYLLNDNMRFDIFYAYSNKENTIGNAEILKQQKYGTSFTMSKNQKAAITGEFNYFSNDFEGNSNSPVGYQMMEGLQPGKNYTWSLLAQKKITKFLDLNLNYFGRKSETSKVIHTGTVQLKAYF